MTKTFLYVVVLGIAGCGALLDKAEPLNVRYFAPTLAEVHDSGGASSQGQAQALRLGRIQASDHLRERIAYRVSESELGYHEALRWTEAPDAYFRRALGRELFESGRFEHVIAGVAPQLEAELTAFEDLRAKSAVRVEARVLVHDGRQVVLERTFRVEESRKDDSPTAIAEALSRALQKCVAQISSEIDNALRASASASAPTTPS
jgi:ABC-type uncharacterized transport system auxiliary subunit